MHNTVTQPARRFVIASQTSCAMWIIIGHALIAQASPFFLTGEGAPPFRLGRVSTCAPIATLPSAEPIHWRALDRSPDGSQLFGISNDELYEIDMATGAANLLGQVGFSVGKRHWFSECADITTVFRYANEGTAGPLVWSLRAVVALTDMSGTTSEFVIDESGVVNDPSQPATLVDHEFEVIDVAHVLFTLSLTDDGVSEFELTQISGSGSAGISGIIVAMTPNANDGPSIPLPMSGLSVAPDGAIYVLSEPQWDPFGEAAIYELDLGGDEIRASHVATPDQLDIRAIEFADDGQLYGGGGNLFQIDLNSGASSNLTPIVGARVIELDYADDAHLYAMARQPGGTSVLIDVSPTIADQVPVTHFGLTPYWSLVSLERDPADLDSDGDVDADDVALFELDYTGDSPETIVPGGIPEPPLSQLVVPYGFFTSIRSEGTRIDMNALPEGMHGTVVEGTPTGLQDTSASILAIQNSGALYLSVQLTDDLHSDIPGEDMVELYFDTNNSDSPVREGNVEGFRATFDSRRIKGGDASVFSAWNGYASTPDHSGQRIDITILLAEANMTTGGTYGFDLAIKDTDTTVPDMVRYFLFSQDADGEQDEGQWGEIVLATGPLAPNATAPNPPSRSTSIKTLAYLEWTNSIETTHNRVYFGSQPDALRYMGVSTSESLTVGPLSPSTTYYWRVDSVNPNGVRRGNVWSFSTYASHADFDGDHDIDEHDRRNLFQRPLGDTTGDGVIDAADLAVIVSALGFSDVDRPYNPAVDYDSDGTITQADLGIWHCLARQAGNNLSGDLDGDGELNGEDIALFVGCLNGPAIPIEPACYSADFEFDNRVDLHDAAIFQRLFGAAQP